MTDIAASIAQEIEAINLSSNSNTKFNQLKQLLGTALSAEPSDVYVTYISEPSNAVVRLGLQAGMQPRAAAVGICGDDALTSKSYETAARKVLDRLTGCPGVVLMTKSRGKWAAAEVFERPGVGFGARIKSLWPNVRVRPLAHLSSTPAGNSGALGALATEGALSVTACDPDRLAARLLMDADRIRDLVDAAMRHRQVVLAGPPGTSKTLVAKELAACLTGGDTRRVTTVQFHPSYGYEDFVEGLRPVSAASGGLEFQRVDGHLIAAARRAQADLAGDAHVLIIDEMNRANLPRVFGELMYLFEYRDEPIDLMVSKGFSLPPNLVVVGTMNTADRSIRSLDTALRRRFDVFEFPEDYEVLGAYFQSGATNDVPDLVDGLRALNEKLGEDLDRHHRVGHAWLMRDPMTADVLRAIWVRQIFPLIEEYFFDRPDLVGDYELPTFWPSVIK